MSRARSPEQLEARRAYSRAWYARNKDKASAYARAYRARNPGAQRRYAIERYGATEEWFSSQLAAQRGRCAICQNQLKPGRETHIDHDHATGRLRGVLCHHCNHLLGHARESVTVLMAAARYLEGVNLDVV